MQNNAVVLSSRLGISSKRSIGLVHPCKDNAVLINYLEIKAANCFQMTVCLRLKKFDNMTCVIIS